MTIPAGLDSVTITVSGVADGVADANQTVILSASAVGWTGEGSLQVIDEDTPALYLEADPFRINEGQYWNGGQVRTTVRVRRDGNLTQPAVVNLTVNAPNGGLHLYGVPTNQVTIPAGRSFVAFEIETENDVINNPGGYRTATIQATAGGYSSGAALVEVSDNELEDYVLLVDNDVVLEAPNTVRDATFTVRRRYVGEVTQGTAGTAPVSYIVPVAGPNFVLDNNSVLELPGRVDFEAAGTVEDNENWLYTTNDAAARPDGIQTFALNDALGGPLPKSNSVDVVIADDESPSLSIFTDFGGIAETGYTLFTVSRPVGTGAGILPLVITLSDPGEARVTLDPVESPSGFFIPAGQTQARFRLGGIDDSVYDADWDLDNDRSQLVKITVRATGFNPAVGRRISRQHPVWQRGGRRPRTQQQSRHGSKPGWPVVR